MTPETEPVRSGRTTSRARPRVALTHASSKVVGVVAREMTDDGFRVVGLDDHTTQNPDISWRLTDVTSPDVVDALSDVDALIHVAADYDFEHVLSEPARQRRERAVREMQTLATAAAAAGVPHLIVVTSAQVYGAHEDNPVPLPEDAALRQSTSDSVAAELQAVEEVVQAARTSHPGLTVTSVRPASVVGGGVDTATTRHFEAPRLLTLKGPEPLWQFCHVEDLGRALVHVVREGLEGVVTVGAPGHLTQTEVEQLSGMKRVEMSASAAHATAGQLHRLGILPTPASDLDFVSYPWVVSSQRLVEAGWFPAYDNATCLSVLLEGVRGKHGLINRRIAGRDVATLGAASAAVALAATAAIFRARRRKN